MVLEKTPKFELAELTPGLKQNDLVVKTKVIEELPEKSNVSSSKPASSDKKSLDVLKLIWENSSEEDKKEFLKWLEKEKK